MWYQQWPEAKRLLEERKDSAQLECSAFIPDILSDFQVWKARWFSTRITNEAKTPIQHLCAALWRSSASICCSFLWVLAQQRWVNPFSSLKLAGVCKALMLNMYNFLGLCRKLWALHMVEVDLSNLRENAAVWAAEPGALLAWAASSLPSSNSVADLGKHVLFPI